MGKWAEQEREGLARRRLELVRLAHHGNPVLGHSCEWFRLTVAVRLVVKLSERVFMTRYAFSWWEIERPTACDAMGGSSAQHFHPNGENIDSVIVTLQYTHVRLKPFFTQELSFLSK